MFVVRSCSTSAHSSTDELSVADDDTAP